LRRFGLPGSAWTGCVLRLRERERLGLFERRKLEWSVDRKRVSREPFGGYGIDGEQFGRKQRG